MKQMLKKYVSLLLCFAVLLGCFAGCAPAAESEVSNAVSSQPAPSASTGEPTQPPAPTGPTRGGWLMSLAELCAPEYMASMRRFEDEQGITEARQLLTTLEPQEAGELENAIIATAEPAMFADVSAVLPCFYSVQAAANFGWIEGDVAAGTFDPDGAPTREYVLTTAARALGYVNLLPQQIPEIADLESAENSDAILRAHALGMFQLDEDKMLRPAEAADETFIASVLQSVKEQPSPFDVPDDFEDSVTLSSRFKGVVAELEGTVQYLNEEMTAFTAPAAAGLSEGDVIFLTDGGGLVTVDSVETEGEGADTVTVAASEPALTDIFDAFDIYMEVDLLNVNEDEVTREDVPAQGEGEGAETDASASELSIPSSVAAELAAIPLSAVGGGTGDAGSEEGDSSAEGGVESTTSYNTSIALPDGRGTADVFFNKVTTKVRMTYEFSLNPVMMKVETDYLGEIAFNLSELAGSQGCNIDISLPLDSVDLNGFIDKLFYETEEMFKSLFMDMKWLVDLVGDVKEFLKDMVPGLSIAMPVKIQSENLTGTFSLTKFGTTAYSYLGMFGAVMADAFQGEPFELDAKELKLHDESQGGTLTCSSGLDIGLAIPTTDIVTVSNVADIKVELTAAENTDYYGETFYCKDFRQSGTRNTKIILFAGWVNFLCSFEKDDREFFVNHYRKLLETAANETERAFYEDMLEFCENYQPPEEPTTFTVVTDTLDAGEFDHEEGRTPENMHATSACSAVCRIELKSPLELEVEESAEMAVYETSSLLGGFVPLNSENYKAEVLSPDILAQSGQTLTGLKDGTGKVKLTLFFDSPDGGLVESYCFSEETVRVNTIASGLTPSFVVEEHLEYGDAGYSTEDKYMVYFYLTGTAKISGYHRFIAYQTQHYFGRTEVSVSANYYTSESTGAGPPPGNEGLYVEAGKNADGGDDPNETCLTWTIEANDSFQGTCEWRYTYEFIPDEPVASGGQ